MDAMAEQEERVTQKVLQRLATIRMPVKRWLSPEEAAEYVGHHPKHMQKLRHEGRGPKFVRKGSRCIRYDVNELDRWMISGEDGDE